MKSALVRVRTQAGDCRCEHYGISFGLVMFMLVDVIFVSMSKSHRRNDAADQQERARHLRLYLPRESSHYGEIT